MSTQPGPAGVRRLELGGLVWTVREAHPAGFTPRQQAVLVFDNGLEQRRLDPAPDGWREWDDTRLQDACLRAVTYRHQGVVF
jgi:hypothetical protein